MSMREYIHEESTPTKALNENLSPIKSPLYEGKKEPEAKILKAQYFREMPLEVTFERLIQYHDKTPQIRLPVSAYRELITGTDMIFNSENEEATDFLNEWVRKNNFYDKFENMVTTLLICGNSILEKLSESETEDVQEVDMSTIIAKKRNDVGELEWYEQRQLQGKTEKLGIGNLDRFIEFNLTNYSQQAWGRSLYYPAAVPRVTGDRITAPLIEILWAMEDAAGAVIINNGYPIKTITYTGANDDYLEKETEKWRRYKPGDARIQKIKPDIEFFESEKSASKYDIYIQQINKAIELASQFPTDIMTGDFTSRASSETTENITTKLVRGYQRYLCNKLKAELFEPILEQNGFNTQDVELEISFAVNNVIDLDVPQVKDLVGSGLMTINEGRSWLRDNTGMELPDDAELQAEKDEQDAKEDEVDNLKGEIQKSKQDKAQSEQVDKMVSKLDRKMAMLEEAAQNNNESLFKSREKSLKKLMEEFEKI